MIGMSSIFDSIIGTTDTTSPEQFVLCIGAALAIGFCISAVYMFRNDYSNSFALTVAILPSTVAVVIMAVSGDIGAGIAVAGAFSLVRFRSAPGSAKEIVVIFLSMASGLLAGMGLVAYAAVFAAIICLVMLVCDSLGFGKKKSQETAKTIRVTVPEDLDYNSEIDTVIEEYTSSMELVNVRTVNMGSMFKLTYNVKLKDESKQKELIDKIRVRNGNLEVSVMHQETDRMGL
jgi:uncharacterized membrane protein YhiD involved in acid resistance